jgi:hypothetical protein
MPSPAMAATSWTRARFCRTTPRRLAGVTLAQKHRCEPGTQTRLFGFDRERLAVRRLCLGPLRTLGEQVGGQPVRPGRRAILPHHAFGELVGEIEIVAPQSEPGRLAVVLELEDRPRLGGGFPYCRWAL